MFNKSWELVLSEFLRSSRAGSPLNLTDRKCVWKKIARAARVPYNKLLTNLACSSRTGEYWPSVVFVRTSQCLVRTVTTSGQYSPVRPSRSVSKRLLLLYNDSEDARFFRGLPAQQPTADWPIRASALFWLLYNSVYYSLIYPYFTYSCTPWGNNYNAPLSQIVKLQNKAVRVINDVPLMASITPHYTSLGLLKFPDIVELNTCISAFLRLFPLVSELYNYSTRSASFNQVAIPSFGTNLRILWPSIIGSFFWNSSGTNHRGKCSEKHFYAGTLLNTNDTLSLL